MKCEILAPSQLWDELGACEFSQLTYKSVGEMQARNMSWGVCCPAPFTSLPVELCSDTAVGAMGVLQEQGLLQRCFMSLALTSGHVQPQVQCEADFVDEPLNSYCSFFTQWSVIYAKKRCN